MLEKKLTKTFKEFFEGEKGGILLIVCTLISLLVANSFGIII
jgi:Na+:H+ antiporter, NhaA family